MRGLILQIIIAIISLLIGIRYILKGEIIIQGWKNLLLIGGIWGILNFFLKPILKFISWPLRVVTFGLFTIIINMLLLWIVETIFPQLIFPGDLFSKIKTMFLIALTFEILNFILTKWI